MNQSNSLCECGSGKKQKKCHPLGAPAYGPERQPKTPEDKALAQKKDMEVQLLLASFPLLFGHF